MPRNSTMYHIGGTKSLRLASKAILKSPWFEGWGTNLENIEKSVRRIYVPDDGMELCQTDQSGAEALIVSYLCKPGKLRELFLNKVKPHVFVALHMFPSVWQKEMEQSGKDIKLNIDELINCAIADLKNHPQWKEVESLIKSSDNWPSNRRYYYMAKQTVHSSNYGITANMLSLNILDKSKGKVVLSKKEAERLLSIYHGLFPEIREWHRAVQRQVLSTGYLFTLQGFPIHIQVCGNPDDREFKEWYALVPQGTVAMITRKAVTDMQQYIESNNLRWDFLQDNHDSMLHQCPISEIRELAGKSKEFMEQELTSPGGEKFRMRSETQVGFNWSPADPKKNPIGLREI